MVLAKSGAAGCTGEQVSEDIQAEEVASTDSELFGRACYGTSRYPEHGVYDSTIIYYIDEILPAGANPFPPMDADRNTLEYRTGAYDFFAERYGMNFDPTIEGDQIVTDGAGGQALVSPIKTGAGETSTHQVYGIDAQDIPQWRHRMPITNVAFRDDGFFVFILSDFQAGGTYNATLRAGDLVVQGEYRMFDHRDRLLDTIVYFADTPATVHPFAGDVAASNGATWVNITCRVESEIFGTGTTRGIGEQTPLPDGSTRQDFRYVMRFPSVLDGGGASWGDRCRNIRPLRRRH